MAQGSLNPLLSQHLKPWGEKEEKKSLEETRAARTMDTQTQMEPEIESVAFESKAPDRGYTVKASYLKGMKEALIEIFKDGRPLRKFTFPAYKVWNIAAHFGDIVDAEIEESSRGYEAAAWDGISGATFIVPREVSSLEQEGADSV